MGPKRVADQIDKNGGETLIRFGVSVYSVKREIGSIELILRSMTQDIRSSNRDRV